MRGGERKRTVGGQWHTRHEASGMSEVDDRERGKGSRLLKVVNNIVKAETGGKTKQKRQRRRTQASRTAKQGRNATKHDTTRGTRTHHLDPSPPPPALARQALSQILPFPSQTLSSTVFFKVPPAENVTSPARRSAFLHHSTQRAKAATEGK